MSREDLFSGFQTRSDTNGAVQKMARGLKFRILEIEGLFYMYVMKTKVLISCSITEQLIITFVFACAKSRFSQCRSDNGTDLSPRYRDTQRFVSLSMWFFQRMMRVKSLFVCFVMGWLTIYFVELLNLGPVV